MTYIRNKKMLQEHYLCHGQIQPVKQTLDILDSKQAVSLLAQWACIAKIRPEQQSMHWARKNAEELLINCVPSIPHAERGRGISSCNWWLYIMTATNTAQVSLILPLPKLWVASTASTAGIWVFFWKPDLGSRLPETPCQHPHSSAAHLTLHYQMQKVQVCSIPTQFFPAKLTQSTTKPLRSNFSNVCLSPTIFVTNIPPNVTFLRAGSAKFQKSQGHQSCLGSREWWLQPCSWSVLPQIFWRISAWDGHSPTAFLELCI